MPFGHQANDFDVEYTLGGDEYEHRRTTEATDLIIGWRIARPEEVNPVV